MAVEDVACTPAASLGWLWALLLLLCLVGIMHTLLCRKVQRADDDPPPALLSEVLPLYTEVWTERIQFGVLPR